MRQRLLRNIFQQWKETGDLEASEEELEGVIEMLTQIIDSAVGIKEYQLMVKDAIHCKHKLEVIYLARHGEHGDDSESRIQTFVGDS